jgi:hypothetical protein
VPLQLTSGDRKILLIASGIFFFLIIVTALFVGGGGSEQEVPTTYSTASGGSRAAYLLLKESGYKITTFEQPLRELTGGRGKTLVLAEPIMAAAREDRSRLDSFLKQGGRLIATGAVAAYYVPSGGATPDPLAGMEWKRQSALSPSALARMAPEITMPAPAYWNQDTGAVALYGEPDKPVVVKYKTGQGEILWLADATPLTNAGLKESGNVEFFFAAMGDPGSTEILWDEYIHGYQRSESPISSSARIIGWISLQVAFFVIAILLAYSRRSGPIWMPAVESRLSPLEFVRTLGSLYQRANAGSVAVDIYYQRFRYLLTRRLGLAVDAPIDDLDRAVRERWPSPEEMPEAPPFAESLRECESCRYDPNVPPAQALRLVQTLFDYARRLKLTPIRGEERKAWKR